MPKIETEAKIEVTFRETPQLLERQLLMGSKSFTSSIKIEQGAALETSIKSLRPPVFWSRQQEFERQARFWTRGKLELALQRFFMGELQCKTTGIPQMALSCQVLIGTCFMGPYNSKLQRSGG